jgi:LPXTG-motif cell wall-anchored protein
MAWIQGLRVVVSTGSRSATYLPQYRNCVYTDVQFYCEFDEDLAAGKQYVPASAMSVVLTKDAPAPSTFDTYAEWQTPDDATRWTAAIRDHGGKPGGGPVLFPGALVVIPAGTTLTKADRNCVPVEGGAATYRCLAGGLDVGETVTWELGLKIADERPSTGTITARTEVVGSDSFGPDRDPSNNTAEFLLNPPVDEDGAGGGGQGGGLPVTGANAAWAAGVGIALLLAGVAALTVARRRRARYVA